MQFRKKNPYSHHGSGLLKVKILEAKYDAKLEIPGGQGGGGVQNKKNVPWGEYGYFLELHNAQNLIMWIQLL